MGIDASYTITNLNSDWFSLGTINMLFYSERKARRGIAGWVFSAAHRLSYKINNGMEWCSWTEFAAVLVAFTVTILHFTWTARHKFARCLYNDCGGVCNCQIVPVYGRGTVVRLISRTDLSVLFSVLWLFSCTSRYCFENGKKLLS